MNWKRTAIAAATVLSVAGVTANAQSPSLPAHGYPGMMGGYGHGHARGFGPGGGPEFHGEHHMGPGMMGGFGMGPGMTGECGMGPAMMGGPGLRSLGRLDLDDQQRKQVVKIEDELRRKNWDVMGKMQDEMAKLRDATWASGNRDRAAILAANKRMADLRLQMLENSLDATDKAEALLTPQQRERFKRLAQSWTDGDRN